MLPKKETLQTARLTLRSFCESDRENALTVLYNDEVKQTYMIPDFPTEDKAIALFHRLMDLSKDERHFVYAIDRGGKLIGWVNDCEMEGNTVELGYVIHPDYKGNGYMTEALTACIRELFRMGCEQILCGYFEENPASHRVMLKAGMRDLDKTDTIDYRGKPHLCRYCEIVK